MDPQLALGELSVTTLIDWVDFLTQGLQKLNSHSKAQNPFFSLPSSPYIKAH
jgi:hypothetical protein